VADFPPSASQQANNLLSLPPLSFFESNRSVSEAFSARTETGHILTIEYEPNTQAIKSKRSKLEIHSATCEGEP
jgi:hypothetical protein